MLCILHLEFYFLPLFPLKIHWVFRCSTPLSFVALHLFVASSLYANKHVCCILLTTPTHQYTQDTHLYVMSTLL